MLERTRKLMRVKTFGGSFLGMGRPRFFRAFTAICGLQRFGVALWRKAGGLVLMGRMFLTSEWCGRHASLFFAPFTEERQRQFRSMFGYIRLVMIITITRSCCFELENTCHALPPRRHPSIK